MMDKHWLILAMYVIKNHIIVLFPQTPKKAGGCCVWVKNIAYVQVLTYIFFFLGFLSHRSLDNFMQI